MDILASTVGLLSVTISTYGSRHAFLPTIFVILVVTVCLFAWGSKKWIFPREDRTLEPAFVGALVGAAGTIFAACIAYSAASQSLEIVRLEAEKTEKQRIENERNLGRGMRENETREIQSLRELLNFMDRLLAVFEGATDGVGDHDFFARIQDADRNGLIVTYNGGAPAPFWNRVSDLIQRLFSIKNSVIQANAMAQNPQRPPAETAEDRNRLNASIRDRIVEAKQMRAEVTAEIDRRQRALAVASE